MARRPSGPRPGEQFAFEVVGRALGVEVEPYDNGTYDRMVDGIFVLSDGTTGAVEVTTLADSKAMQAEALAFDATWRVNGALWPWIVNFGPGLRFDELRRHLPALVLLCEASGVVDPDRTDLWGRWRNPDEAAAVAWFDEAPVSLLGTPVSPRAGSVDVLPYPDGGAACDNLDDLPTWLETQLTSPSMAENLAKLRESRRAELHLWLRVHETGMPWKHYYATAVGDQVPPVPLRAPEGLTGLWIAPRWHNPILWWDRQRGWQRQALPPPPRLNERREGPATPTLSPRQRA